MSRALGLVLLTIVAIGCDDDDFENPCDPQNIAAGNCIDAMAPDARIVDMALDRAVDAAPDMRLLRDQRVIDMAPDQSVDMAPPVDMGLVPDMAPDMAIPDMAPDMGPGCVNPAYNPDCAASEDAESCVANGGQWGQWVFAAPPVESCDCATRDGGCPCANGGECDVLCYVPVNEGNDGCSDEPPRCWERTQNLGCSCDPMAEGIVCP